MRLITPHTRAALAAERWRHQYYDDHNNEWNGNQRQAIHKALLALGPTPDPDQVTAVIGNSSWVTTNCHECNTPNVPTVQLGQEPDYDSSTAQICSKCLLEAHTLTTNDTTTTQQTTRNPTTTGPS